MIWFDVTEIKNWRGHYTGIQRVISKLGQQLSDDSNVGFCYYDPLINNFRVFNFNFDAEVVYESGSTRASISSKKQLFVEKLKKKASPELKDKVKKLIAIKGVHNDVVEFHEDDTLFIPGAFWIYSFEHLVALKQQQNIKIVGVMYDLVPLVTPQFTATVTVDGFKNHFPRAVGLFDEWFAISDNTKRDMLQVAENESIKLKSSKIHVIRLGVDDPKDTMDSEKQQRIESLKPQKFALFVSTIEARKNQALVYQAVKLLREQSKNHVPIVLVGKHGWLSDDIIYILKNDSTLKDKLIWLDRVDDRGLRWLYANCAFTIYPSYYEGWGLPVAESLAIGKPCIASNASSIPEVAGELIEYFSPYDSGELAGLIYKYSDEDYVKKRSNSIKEFTVPTWEVCAEQVRHILNMK